jgi:hypothetical protein
MKFSLYIFCLLVFFSIKTQAINRVDSFNIQHTSIHLEIRNFSQKIIKGMVKHDVKLNVNTNYVVFDLKGMTVDSVRNESGLLVFQRNGDQLSINLEKTYAIAETTQVEIFYRGTPAADPSGWGGFYFTGDYAFNLGVGFQVNPHSFGRAWFPCVDEFNMKSSYDLNIETDTNYTAACNGVLTHVTSLPNSKIWHYSESVPLSAYLVSVSVSKYAIVSSDYSGMTSKFPVWLMSVPGDTIKVKNSFVNLPKAIEAFEKAFGPQIFSKVGYNMVPFSGGAMEHAGNITYPAPFADGGLAYETLMAHELAHHWWGNNVTCETAEDMWLNEGWASFCEHLFTEAMYGKEAYKTSILKNHLFVLRFAHVRDQNIFGLTDIPHSHTYGSHVYKKGADVIHSMRGVMGDSAFFRACKKYHEQYYLKNASTDDLMNVFEQESGQKAVDFFENWVKEKGFPHVTIVKQIHSGNSPYQLKFFTKQNPRFTEKLYRNLPIEVFFFRDRNHFVKKTITIQNETDSFQFDFDFKPVFVCLDFDEKLSDAITERYLKTNAIGVFDLPETFSKINIKKAQDSSFFRVEHHWVGPEKYVTQYPVMSKTRYVSLDGIWHDSVQFDLELSYDGRIGGASSTIGYLDNGLINRTEDSLTVMYRGFPGDYWREWQDIQGNKGSLFDRQGNVIIKNAKKGDYVFAMRDYKLNTPRITVIDSQKYAWTISPNPAKDVIRIDFKNQDLPKYKSSITLLDALGKQILIIEKKLGATFLEIDISQLPSGVYFINYLSKGFKESKKVIVER